MLIELGLFITMIMVSLTVLLAFLQWWKQQRYTEMIGFVKEAVAAAEQIHVSATGPAKLEWVQQKITNHFPQFSKEIVLVLIEAAVYRQQSSVKPVKASAPQQRMSGYDHR